MLTRKNPTPRPLLLASLLSLLVSPAASAQQKKDTEEGELVGPVRVVLEYEAELSRAGGRLVESERRLGSAETYDVSGRRLTYTAYTDGGAILYGDAYVRDAQGRLIEERTEHSPYVYLPDRKTYLYDARGHLVEEVGYDEKGNVLGRYVYKNDEAGNRLECLSVPAGRNLVYRGHKRVYTYDGEGRVITSAGFKPSGQTFVPDDSGLGYHKEIYLYDSAGRRSVTTQFRQDGSLFRVSVSEYDARGNEVAAATYNADGSLREKSRYEYEFDARGNWVRQITSEWVTEGGKSFFTPTEVSYRTIKYFKSAPGPRRRARRPGKRGRPAEARSHPS